MRCGFESHRPHSRRIDKINILLKDIDSKIPNLALMKISRYYKEKGHKVGFNVKDPDKIFASVIFKKNRWKVKSLKHFYPDAEIHIGGSGYSLDKKLKNEIDKCKPDYSIYPECDYSLGFTTRGCPNNCYFCVVPEKEGEFRINRHPKDFHNKDFDKIKLLDNNILADKDWFFKVTEWILERDLKVEFNQGLDIKLTDKDVAERISELKTFKQIKFAFDMIKEKDDIIEGIKLLKDAGINVRNKVMFYVYCHNDDHVESALKRCQILKEQGTNPFVMCNVDKKRSERMKDLQRWANRKAIFWSTKFKNYKSGP